MAFKIVGADENSDFPARVEARLAAKFTNEAYVDAQKATAVSEANTYTDTAISNIETGGGLSEDPNDPGFFVFV